MRFKPRSRRFSLAGQGRYVFKTQDPLSTGTRPRRAARALALCACCSGGLWAISGKGSCASITGREAHPGDGTPATVRNRSATTCPHTNAGRHDRWPVINRNRVRGGLTHMQAPQIRPGIPAGYRRGLLQCARPVNQRQMPHILRSVAGSRRWRMTKGLLACRRSRPESSNRPRARRGDSGRCGRRLCAALGRAGRVPPGLWPRTPASPSAAEPSIAARFERPESTVRRWLRAAREPHAEWLYRRGVDYRPQRPGLVVDRLLRSRAALGRSAVAAAQLRFGFRRALPRPASPVTMQTKPALLMPDDRHSADPAVTFAGGFTRGERSGWLSGARAGGADMPRFTAPDNNVTEVRAKRQKSGPLRR